MLHGPTVPQPLLVALAVRTALGFAPGLSGCDLPANPPHPAPVAAERIATVCNVPNLWRVHLAFDGVTCWGFSSGERGGLSCLPDSQLGPGTRARDSPDTRAETDSAPGCRPGQRIDHTADVARGARARPWRLFRGPPVNLRGVAARPELGYRGPHARRTTPELVPIAGHQRIRGCPCRRCRGLPPLRSRDADRPAFEMTVEQFLARGSRR